MNTFDTYFSERIIDNNGVSVSDINKGISTLIPIFIESLDLADEPQSIILDETYEGQPDLVAHDSSYFGDQDKWWVFCLSNFLNDPFKEVKSRWIYYLYDPVTYNTVTTTLTADNKSEKIGTVVTLN